jgi:PAS domain S-box-containing protein
MLSASRQDRFDGAVIDARELQPIGQHPLFADTEIGDEVAWAIVAAAPDGIVVIDDGGDIVLANERMEAVFGFDRGELLGCAIDQLLPIELDTILGDRRPDPSESTVRPVGAARRLRGRRKDGKRIHVEVGLSWVPGPRAHHTIAVVRDVTERMAAERTARAAHDRAHLAEERERVARDLHDTVIQELFAIGMRLQSLSTELTDDDHTKRVITLVDGLDDVIREIRTVIFDATTRRPSRGSLQRKVEAIVSELTPALGFTPTLEFSGDLDVLPASVVAELVPSVREALSNVARHARAGSVTVEIWTQTDRAGFCIVDDGVGLDRVDPDHRGCGLSNLATRAGRLGGSCRVEAAPDGGCSVRWDVPVRSFRGWSPI